MANIVAIQNSMYSNKQKRERAPSAGKRPLSLTRTGEEGGLRRLASSPAEAATVAMNVRDIFFQVSYIGPR
ncbi:hypothetical protein MTO96_035026 [Rhipicephalus appendiculatus]